MAQMLLVWQDRPSAAGFNFYRVECRKRDDNLPRGSPEQLTWHLHGMRLALCDGRDDDARAELEWFRELGMGYMHRLFMWSVSVALLAETVTRIGRPEEAGELYALMLPHAAHNVQNSGAVAFLGAFSHYLGMLATRLRHWEAAEGHFTEAVLMHQRMGAEALLAHSRLEWAGMLAARDEPGDVGRGLRLLDEVDGVAASLGLVVVRRRATALRAHLVGEITRRAGS